MTNFRTWTAAVAFAVTTLTACVPMAAPASSEPVAGCRRHTSGGPDVHYTGEPSEYGNLTFWTSRDGSCSGSVVDDGTLIVAPSAADAAFLCDALLRARLAGRVDATQGPWSEPFGPMGYACAAGEV